MTNYENIVASYSEMFSREFAGFRCGPGWARTVEFVLFVWRLAKIEVAITSATCNDGTLKLATMPTEVPLVDELVLVAALRSEDVCEVCGTAGRLREDDGWIRARCDVHSTTPCPY